jgi:dUTPase
MNIVKNNAVQYHLKKVDGLNVPQRANTTDAGYDVIATTAPKIVGEEIGGGYYKRIDYIEYETNLYIAPQSTYSQSTYETKNFHTDLRPRSSISKYNLVLANSIGLIDRGYRNQVLVRFKYIWQPEDYILENGMLMGSVNKGKIYNNGDKICQLVPMETLNIEFVKVDNLDTNDRGGGFGSTDKIKSFEKLTQPSYTKFNLKRPSTIKNFFSENKVSQGINPGFVETHLANFHGEIYEFEEGNGKGLCVVDESGTVHPTSKILMLTKT